MEHISAEEVRGFVPKGLARCKVATGFARCVLALLPTVGPLDAALEGARDVVAETARQMDMVVALAVERLGGSDTPPVRFTLVRAVVEIEQAIDRCKAVEQLLENRCDCPAAILRMAATWLMEPMWTETADALEVLRAAGSDVAAQINAIWANTWTEALQIDPAAMERVALPPVDTN